MTPDEAARRCRTLLFVPGDRPERFEKAVAARPDLVVVDLEDAVAPRNKDSARMLAVQRVAGAENFAIRVNATPTPWHAFDVAALGGLASPVIVLLPKAEDPPAVSRFCEALPIGSSVIAMIETALGVLNAVEIGRTTGVSRLALGTYDLGAELGVDPENRLALSLARGTLVLASAAAGLPGPVDGVTGEIQDRSPISRDTTASAALGFTGKLCIHPAQVRPAALALAPSADDVMWAGRVLEALDQSGGVALLDGKMIDAPVASRARRICAAASPPITEP